MLPRVFSIVALLSLAVAAGGQDGAKLVGTWKSKTKVSGLDEILTIAETDGKWTVKGTYQKKDKEVGSYVGVNVKEAGGVLTFTHRFMKKPAASFKDDYVVTVERDGDELRYSYAVPKKAKTVHHFERQGGEPKVAKVVPKEKPPTPETKPAEPAGPQLKEERILAQMGWGALYSPDGKVIAVASKEGSVSLIQAGSPWTVTNVPGVPGGFRPTLAFTADSQFLVCPDGNMLLNFISVTTKKSARTIPVPRKDKDDVYVQCYALSLDGKTAAIRTQRQNCVFNLATGGDGVDLENCIANGFFFRRDNAAVYGWDGDGRINAWDTATGKKIESWQVVPKGGGGVERCDVSGDRKLAAAVSGRAGEVHLWDLEAGKAIGKFAGIGTFHTAAAVSADGKLVAVAGFPPKTKTPDIKLWDVEGGKELSGVKSLPGAVFQMSFSPDNKYLVAASGGNMTTKSAVRLFALP